MRARGHCASMDVVVVFTVSVEVSSRVSAVDVRVFGSMEVPDC